MGEKVTDASRFFQISKYLVFWRPVLPGNPSLSPHGRCFNWETLTQGMFWHFIGLNWNEAGSVMVVPSQVKRTKRERERRKEKAGNARGGQVRHWSLLFKKEQETRAWARLRLKSPFFSRGDPNLPPSLLRARLRPQNFCPLLGTPTLTASLILEWIQGWDGGKAGEAQKARVVKINMILMQY